MTELLQESLFRFNDFTVEEAINALRDNDVPCLYVPRDEVVNQPQVIASNTIFRWIARIKENECCFTSSNIRWQ